MHPRTMQLVRGEADICTHFDIKTQVFPFHHTTIFWDFSKLIKYLYSNEKFIQIMLSGGEPALTT